MSLGAVGNTKPKAAQDILDAEFQWIRRVGDMVVKAYSPKHGKFLVLNELQLCCNVYMP